MWWNDMTFRDRKETAAILDDRYVTVLQYCAITGRGQILTVSEKVF